MTERIPARYMFGGAAAVLICGIVVAIFEANTIGTSNWTITNLGANETDGALMLNMCTVFTAFILYATARSLITPLSKLSGKHVNSVSFFTIMLTIIATLLIAIGLFNYDRFATLHSILYLSLLISLFIMAANLRTALPMFARTFHIASMCWIIISLAVFVVGVWWLGIIPSLLFEAYMFGSSIYWLYLVFKKIDNQTKVS